MLKLIYLFLNRFQGFDDAANTEIVVIFRAVQSTNNQIDDTEMVVIGLFLGLSHFSCFFFFCFKSFHDFLCLLVFVDHDIADAEIGNHDGGEAQHVVCIFIDDRFVVPDGFVISFEDKEDMGDIKFPGLMIGTELCALPEQFLND